MKIKMIAATDLNYGIGKTGDLLFRIPEDMKLFKELTVNNIVLMGRKTYESIGDRPLPDRINIVISSSVTVETDCVLLFNDLEPAIEYCKTNYPDKELYIIGGGQIYRQAIGYADEIVLTVYNREYDGADTYFPTFEDSGFRVVDVLKEGVYDGAEYRTVRAVRLKLTDKV